MILGSPLGAAPRFGFTIEVFIPETSEVFNLEVILGQPIEIREDDRVAAIVKIIGLYSKDESSNS